MAARIKDKEELSAQLDKCQAEIRTRTGILQTRIEELTGLTSEHKSDIDALNSDHEVKMASLMERRSVLENVLKEKEAVLEKLVEAKALSQSTLAEIRTQVSEIEASLATTELDGSKMKEKLHEVEAAKSALSAQMLQVLFSLDRLEVATITSYLLHTNFSYRNIRLLSAALRITCVVLALHHLVHFLT